MALKLLVSLISRLVACSPRFRLDTQTDGQTDKQNDYCNPRCACAPRVNYSYIPGINIVHTTISSELERILGLMIRDLDILSFTLCLCGRLCKYFRGSQHLEEIMLKENIQRSQLLTLIDKFSEILVTCTLPEHCRVL